MKEDSPDKAYILEIKKTIEKLIGDTVSHHLT